MNLRDLEYVRALAETRHFGRAAEKCFVSQPTLSTQIAKLEQELGVTLFERDKRRVVPTQAGLRVLEHAQEALDAVREIHEVAAEATDALNGPFYLGVIPTIGPYFLPYVLPVFDELYPKAELYLREEVTARLVERLKNAKIDAALLSLPLDDPNIVHDVIYEEDFVVALPPQHPLTKRKKLRLSDINDETILMLEEGNCMRDQTLQLCGGARDRSGEDYRAMTIESLRQMVGAGLGCTLLPKMSTQEPFGTDFGGEIRRFVRPAPTRSIVLARRKSYPKAEALKTLVEALRSRLANLT